MQRLRRRGLRLGVTAAALACFSLFALSQPALAAPFEQVGTFAGSAAPVPDEEFGEEVQLGGVGGMAVNHTGAGGVEAGTTYAATRNEGTRIAMYSPSGDGLKFSVGWEVTPVEQPYERCGPALPTKCRPRANSAPGLVDVDVDQETGNVYVFNGEAFGSSEFRLVTIFDADGSDVIARFGQRAVAGKTIAETPGQIHESGYRGGIAVNGAGDVYLFDENAPDNFYHRLMVFQPKVPGDYSEYEYAGEVAAGSGGGDFPTGPIVDAAGNLYVGAGAGGDHIEMRPPEAPAPFPALPTPPICQFDFAKGGITMATVNPETGEVFFFSYKKPKRVYRLAPCDEETGKFKDPVTGKEIIGEMEVKPERDDLWGLAFDPTRALAGRPPGVLYGGAPGAVPSSGVGPGEPGQGSLGYIFAAAEEIPPVVKSVSVRSVTATSAQLHAVIDPGGHETHYYFQYRTEASYLGAGESFEGASEAPAGGAIVGGSGPQSVGVTLTGLTPDTPYVYRAVAESECAPAEPGIVCEGASPARRFRTFPTGLPPLPDNRGYELVSPANKNGGQVFPADPRIDSCGSIDCKPGAPYTHFPMQSTPDGDAVVYEGNSFGLEEGTAIENEHKSVRTPSGWQSTNLTPQLLRSNKNNAGYKAFDTELTEGILEQLRPALSSPAPPEYSNLYSQSTSSLTLNPLLTTESPNRTADQFKLSYAGASDDLSRVFFAANDALTAEVPGIAPAALDGGVAEFNLYEWERSTEQLRLVNVMPANATTQPGASFGSGSAHTISSDGSRAFWSGKAGELYVREDAATTREIPAAGEFLAAATDGSKVLLDDGSLYDLEAEETIDLTAGAGGFQGLVGQSDDLANVYFVDTAVLTGEEENSEGDKAQAGENNLYVWAEGSASFVTTLLPEDNSGGNNELSADWNPRPSARTAEASPNGRFVAFVSQAPLTGYENVGPCESDHAGGFVDGSCPEVFIYDAATDQLTCASCNPSGARPMGWAVLRQINGPASLPQPRYLLDFGRLYFDSQDSLSPLDTNGGIEDVYQFQAPGTGDCERTDGCVALISGGRQEVDSNLLAIDATGKNVFFTSRDRLVAKDKDELIDLYVAREGGGEPPAPESLTGEVPPQAPPFEPTPASPTLNDSGNVKASKGGCRKGQIKKKGKCVKKPKPKKGKKAKRGASR